MRQRLPSVAVALPVDNVDPVRSADSGSMGAGSTRASIYPGAGDASPMVSQVISGCLVYLTLIDDE